MSDRYVQVFLILFEKNNKTTFYRKKQDNIIDFVWQINVTTFYLSEKQVE